MKTLKFFVPFFIVFVIRNCCISADDRFIKRYALMKMYESCFGPEAVKEVRKEMKIALAKCSGAMPAAAASQYSASAAQNATPKPSLLASLLQTKHHLNSGDRDNSYSSEHLKTHSASSIDLNKLQQAILAGYNKNIIQQQQQHQHQQHQQPTSYSSNLAMNGGLAFSPVRSWNYAAAPLPPPAANPYPYPQNNGLLAVQHAASPAYMASLHYPMYPFQHYPFLSPFYASARSSRDLDVKGQLESLAVRMSGRIRNVTCIMQELGYMNENLEPDYQKIIERVKKLSIPDDLKSEMTDSVEYCRQFSLCVPEESKDKFSRDMVKPMFFFRCYKHKKMEACIIKDIKDRYSSDEVDDNMIGMERNDRSKHEFDNNDFAELAIYEFLYGADGFDIDDIL
ncbi:uncharacterized protein LOC135839893 [Planococcus citri]|uniref:uncharacterized protein LOC135839893 n=1 Tax=Planococcus citri TaxID=170843 RepID=UPI0031F902B4